MSKKAKKPVEVVEKVVLEVPSPASFDDARRLSALGNLERLRALVASSAEGPQAVIAEKDDLGFTALAWAARNGHSAVVSFLVKECDADIESEAAGRAKPIHLAVNGSHEASLAILIAAKADVNSTDELGNTALHLCVHVRGASLVAGRPGGTVEDEAHEELVFIFVARSWGRDPLWERFPSRGGILSIITMLLGAGADVNARNRAGVTPLMLAVNSGHSGLIDLFLRSDADASMTDSQGNTALHIAAAHGFASIAQALLAGGATSTSNRAGKTPADLALNKATRELFV